MQNNFHVVKHIDQRVCETKIFCFSSCFIPRFLIYDNQYTNSLVKFDVKKRRTVRERENDDDEINLNMFSIVKWRRQSKKSFRLSYSSHRWKFFLLHIEKTSSIGFAESLVFQRQSAHKKKNDDEVWRVPHSTRIFRDRDQLKMKKKKKKRQQRTEDTNRAERKRMNDNNWKKTSAW